MTGSLNGRGWDDLRPIAVTLALVVPVVLLVARHIRALELGDDAARAGVRVERSRRCCWSPASLSPPSPPSAGPIGFVALMAPQITRQLVGGRALGLLPAAAEGRCSSLPPTLWRGSCSLRIELPVGLICVLGARICSTSSPVPTATCPENEDVRLPSAARCRRRLARLRLPVPAPHGKSTLLRGLALLAPSTGAVLLDGQDIARLPTRAVAARVGILPQQPSAPGGLTVADLVGRGRHPHQRWFRQWSPADAAAEEALELTAMTELADRLVDELSGGQRQRAWIALALAQGAPLMLLDEPTTFLDLAHQFEVLDLLADLNAREGTIVMVLDLNLACRYADHVVAMCGGTIVAEGDPTEVVGAALVAKVFGLQARDPRSAHRYADGRSRADPDTAQRDGRRR